MRLQRAIKLVSLSGVLSTLFTIALWSAWVKRPGPEDALLEANRRQANFVLTQYHNRGTNSVGGGRVQESDDVEDVNINDNGQNDVENSSNSLTFHPIDCHINEERVVRCRKEGSEVFLPFEFVKEYFEVFGNLESLEDGSEAFKFHHANSIVHPPRASYKPSSMFMAFDHYNVENRDRVKCVTASEGVPITTQWSKNGYHYPIQVAQFALSHHAKHIVDDANGLERRVLQDGEEGDDDDDDDKAGAANFHVLRDVDADVKGDNQDNHILEFSTTDSHLTKGVSVSVNEKKYFCFFVDLKFATNGSLTVVVDTTKGVQMKIHYVFSSSFVSYDGRSNIYYGMGTDRLDQWFKLVRNLKFDLLKGLLTRMKLDKAKSYALTKIVEIRFHGHGWMDNLTLARFVHMEQFYDAANWLVRHQDSRGGWPIMVQRRVVVGVLELAPGWYSAMGQGQAMSVLVRAYLDSKDTKYLETAVRALGLFQVDSAQGGVRARFFGKYDWYEEYPTIPSSFVLNGFIYSLLGLYDLKETATGEGRALAEQIFNSGMTSLKHMIGMYDSGAGTFYDLRHITAGIEPNRARWDYHTTHINQLLQLMIIDDDDIFKTTVQRWLGYLKGKRSRHN